MAPRNTRRQRPQDEYLEEDSEEYYKRRKVEKKATIIENDLFENDEDFQEAINELDKQRKNQMLLIETELRMRVENANNLAQFEENRINKFYEDQVAELKKHQLEERQIKTRQMSAEESRQHQLLPRKNDGSVQHISKKEQCCLTVPLKEDEMIEDLLLMARSTREMCERQGLPRICVTVPLSGNRLLLNDHVIYPNTPCLVRNGSSNVRECVFMSTTVKDKDLREKRKEGENGSSSAIDAKIVLKVNATRKKRYPIESLRNGELQLEFKEEDLVPPSSNTCNTSDELNEELSVYF